MADNFIANAGSGGDTFAADDISSVKYPRSKISLGVDGSAADAEGGAGAVTLGVQRITLASDDPAVVDLAAMEVLQTTIASDTTSLDTKITACNTGAVTISAALPAGTNAIGKLAANSGVDIGDVDVTSLPGSMSGPGSPVIDSYTNTAINLTIGDNQILVAAPGANKQIWVYEVVFSCSIAGTGVSFQDEDDTAISGVCTFAQYGGINSSPSGNFSMPKWKLATNKALEVDVTAGDIDGWIGYAIVSV